MKSINKPFPAVDILSMDHRDGTKTIGLVFESKPLAEELDDFLNSQPHSFSFEKLGRGKDRLVLRFTNSDVDHFFQLPEPIGFYVNYPEPFYLQIIFRDKLTRILSPVGSPYLRSFDILN